MKSLNMMGGVILVSICKGKPPFYNAPPPVLPNIVGVGLVPATISSLSFSKSLLKITEMCVTYLIREH